MQACAANSKNGMATDRTVCLQATKRQVHILHCHSITLREPRVRRGAPLSLAAGRLPLVYLSPTSRGRSTHACMQKNTKVRNMFVNCTNYQHGQQVPENLQQEQIHARKWWCIHTKKQKYLIGKTHNEEENQWQAKYETGVTQANLRFCCFLSKHLVLFDALKLHKFSASAVLVQSKKAW